MKKAFWLLWAVCLAGTTGFSLYADEARDSGKASPQLRASAELGYLAVMDHKIQQSKAGTYFDYDDEGGQDVLFPVSRLSLDLTWGRHTWIFLYQPLALESRTVLTRDVTVDEVTFTEGTPMRFFYGFPFYRISYLYDLNPREDLEVAIGLSLQIRNATIEFESLDGTQFTSNRNVGPVPILKFRLRHDKSNGFWWGAEADGFYAPISYLNGSDNEVVGAILDASLRCGFRLTKSSEIFLNLRYLGGGAVGTSEDDTGPGDGYTKNWLHFLTTTAGFNLILPDRH